MKTEDLIDSLARDVEPVRRLRHPWLRTAAWLAATVAYLYGVVLMMSPRAPLMAGFADPRFSLEQLAAVLIGLTAGAAALSTVIPGRSPRVLLAPIAAGVLWIAVVVVGCAQDVLRYGTSIPLESDWRCLPYMLVGGLPPAGALALMLRRGAPLTPRLTLALAGLSAAALANVTSCLVSVHDTSITVLLWHGTTIVLLGVVAGRWERPCSHGSSPPYPAFAPVECGYLDAGALRFS